MSKIFIITQSFFDFEKNKILIGGLQTYVIELSKFLKNNHYDVLIFQKDKNIRKVNYAELEINSYTSNDQSHYNKIYNSVDIFILSTEYLKIRSNHRNTIVLQHGIAFDIPKNYIKGLFGKTDFLTHLNKFLRCIYNVKRFHNHKNMVCVDYNYYNWIRTLSWIKEDQNITVIPNFSYDLISKNELKNKLSKNKDRIKIIFARRFVDYRGTEIFINVSKKLLSIFEDIEITFAGEGPLKDMITKTFQNNNRIRILEYNSTNSILFHKDYDISVVPTIFSEGTSLALIEAMAAGCFPIATHVGGLTNIVIDKFNGRLSQPDETSLLNIISEVIQMEQNEFNEIVNCAHDCIIRSFSKEKWEMSWSEVLNKLS